MIALTVLFIGIKCAYLLNQSIIVQILVFPCMDLGNAKMKSMDMLSRVESGIGNGCSNPTYFPLSYLVFWHTKHFET